MKDFTMNVDCLDPAPVTAGNFLFPTMSRPALGQSDIRWQWSKAHKETGEAKKELKIME